VPWIRGLFLNFAFICGSLAAWQQAPPKDQAPAKQQGEQAPPEEDEALQPSKEYSFNPLQAEKELRIGIYYFKKGSYKAAANRFREAVKWNPGYAEAYLRLGEVEEKRKDRKAAREAYAKFVELAPEDKRAEGARKKLGAN
jgi:tetratricopeptide (TPR) repeat protein